MRQFLMIGMMCAMGASTALTSPAFARDRGDRGDMPTANQIIDEADARIARFKADLQLTPDQDKNWGGLQSALHDAAQRRAAMLMKAWQADRAPPPAPTAVPPATTPVPPDNRAASDSRVDNRDARPVEADRARDRDDRYRDDRSRDRDRPDRSMIDGMRMQADIAAARADDLRKLADAAAPLYGTLDTRQQRRFGEFIGRYMEIGGERRR